MYSTELINEARSFMFRLLKNVFDNGGSDLFISADFPPSMKHQGLMKPLSSQELSADKTKLFAHSIMNDKQREEFERELECNFAISIPDVSRFRVNIFQQQMNVGMVIRTITSEIPNFTKLKLPPSLKDVIMEKRGLILVVGGTGSGKSTSLAAMIDHRNENSAGHIITVEDPVEYRILGVNQVAVNNKAGLTFANGLRTILRQDPNVIMVGEVRDKETAEITINAALTGHLVFSTLHTNDSAGAITRLLDMGVEPFLVVSSVRGVIAQRLVRVICQHCKKEYVPEPYSDERLYLGVGDHEPITLWKGEGCARCNFTGYMGRMSIHEVLPINEEMKAMIMNGEADNLIFEAGRKFGTTSMKEDGIEKVMQGKTTVSELLRVAYV